MSKRKLRSAGNADSLEAWREQMEHGHVAGYWASVGKLPPAAYVRSTSGCSMLLFGSMLLLGGIIGSLAGRPGTLLGSLGAIMLGSGLLWLGNRTLRRRRRRRHHK